MTESFLCSLQEVASSGDEAGLLSLLRSAQEQSEVTAESNLTEQGSTMLMILAAMGRDDLVRAVLSEEKAPAVDQVNYNGTTALVFACARGHLNVVRELCERGADVNWVIESLDTPVMIAAEEGFHDIVSYLCSREVQLENQNELGRTALHVACNGGHLDTISVLLDGGANIEAKDKTQATPLVVACMNGFVDVARLLLEKGANTQCVSEAILTATCDRNETGKETVDGVKLALINVLNSYHWIPSLDLHRSCQQDDIITMKRLFSTYTSIVAGVYGCGSAHPVVRIAYGGGASPLMVACLANAMAVVEFLVLEYPASYNKEKRPENDCIDGKELVKVSGLAAKYNVYIHHIHGFEY